MAKRDTTWFYNRKFGFSSHFLAQGIVDMAYPTDINGLSWREVIENFDTDNYAKQLSELGAGYIILTMVQQSSVFLTPNKTFDEIAGYAPLLDYNKPDFVERMYDSLLKYDIDLLLYFPCDGPSIDPIARKAFGAITEGLPNPYVTDEFIEKWARVIREYSLKYGKKVKGWWLDGCYYNIGHTDAKLSKLAEACRAGNDDALISCNLYGLVDDTSAINDRVPPGLYC